MSRYLEIGAAGWKHAGWQESYYPEDMPGEWQLSFYAHSFRVVLVPFANWQGDQALVDEEEDDLGDEFHFFLMLPLAELAVAGERLQQLRDELDQRWGGVVLQLGAGDAADQVQAAVAGLGGRVVIDSRGLEPSQAEALAAAGLELAWRGGDEGSGLAIVGDDQLQDLRALGDLVKRFVGQMPEQGVSYLFIAGEPPQMARMQEAVTIAEVMGIA